MQTPLSPPLVLAALAVALGGAVPSPSAAGVTWTRQPNGSLVVTGEGRPVRDPAPVERSSVSAVELVSRVEHHALRAGLDPKLVHAVVRVESDYDLHALSVDGAMGLMQLMPQTARELGVEDAWDPEENLRAGTEYLARLVERFGGRVDLALAGYNAGPEAVERFDGVPPFPETVEYVDRVLSLAGGETQVGWSRGRLRRRPVFLTRSPSQGIVVTTIPPARP